MLMCFCEEPMLLENESVNIFATKCGHIFHNSCLVQWLEKSQTCPQCRSEVTESEMFRLYPALTDEQPNDELNNMLQSCLDSLDDTKQQLEQMSALCKEKDDIIANLRIEAEKVKTFGRENEALKSLLQMLDGLKDMAAIICKSAGISVQLDALTQLRTEPSNAGTAVIQTGTETLDADAVVTQSGTESSDTDIMTQPTESSDVELRSEAPDVDTTGFELRMESPDEATMTQPSMQLADTDHEITHSRSEAADTDDGITQSRTESSEAASAVIQPSTDSDDAEDTAVTLCNNISSDSTADAETTAIESSLNTLGYMLIRISEIKNSNRENRTHNHITA